MGIMNVEKFLCCLSLEVGGYVCSIFTAAVAAMAIIANFFAITFNFGSQDPGLWTMVVINFIYYLLLFYASVMLFFGTKNSQPSKMQLYLIFMLIGVIIAFLQILVVGWQAVFGAILWALIVFYFFVCIRSLFKKVGGGSIMC